MGGIRRLEMEGDILLDIEREQKLIDLKPLNGNYTCSNTCFGSQHIARWLDCFMIHESFFLYRLAFETNILLAYGFDHWTFSLIVDITNPALLKPFHFEKFWLDNKEFQDIVENFSITCGSIMYHFQQNPKKKKIK